jgi:pyruvate ferredoxin oxidoreductase delta subunit
LIYRGIFQRTLAKNIARGIVLAARKEGKVGIAFGRYSDSPERNGIPAKQFAIIADNDDELQMSMAQYEPQEVDVSIALDDTLSKGVESWGWYGLQPANKLTKENGTLIITSSYQPDQLVPHLHIKKVPYNLAVVKGSASFSGLWVFKDDHTDVRILGVLPRVAPELVSSTSIEQMIREQWNDELKVTSAEKSFENPYFKKFSTRTMRPVVDFSKCTKCTLCWLQCPDSCFDVTPDGYYDAHMEACCGCGVCEAVCPVKNCVTMVSEIEFTGNESQWEAWKADEKKYAGWLKEKIAVRPERSHGYHHRGQYQEENAKQGD